MSIETSKHLSPRCMLSPFEELDTDALRDTYDAVERPAPSGFQRIYSTPIAITPADKGH